MRLTTNCTSYVDDLFLTGDDRLIGDCKSNLAVEFEMKDLGLMHSFLGLEVWQRDGCFFTGQGKYTVEIHDGRLQAYGHTSSFQLKED